jgi:hypothetical protein
LKALPAGRGIMRKKDLLSETRKKLLEMAAQLKIPGRSRMTKAALAEVIARAGRSQLATGSARSAQTKEAPEGSKKRRGRPLRDAGLVRRSWREQQAVVQHAKFETQLPSAPRVSKEAAEPRELPSSYDLDRIVLLVRDPYWIHAYWDISRGTLLKARTDLGDEWHYAKSILRVYDVTGVDFDGRNASSSFDIEITGGASNWYVNTKVPNRTYCIEIGLLSRSGDFLVLARSNRATTPRDAPSEVGDEQWMIPDWEFEKVYALSGGFSVGAGSLELKEMMEKQSGRQAPGTGLLVQARNRANSLRGYAARCQGDPARSARQASA